MSDTTVDPTDASQDASSRAPRLFRTVWRWHFYAGLLVIPFVVLLSLSGIVYLFKPQIDALAYGSLREVTPTSRALSYEAQTAAVLAAHPGATIGTLTPPPAADRATEVDITTDQGQGLRVYVDPYSGKVKGDRDPSASFTTLALELHGMLLFNRITSDEEGTWGDRILELSASWAIVLVITGLYLWWPRRRRDGTRSFRAALTPRLGARSIRIRWRDAHAVTGVVFGFLTLFLLATGLAWTGIWGVKFGEVATSVGANYPAGAFDGASSTTIGDLTKTGKPQWSTGALPLAPSAVPERSQERASVTLVPVAAAGTGPLGSSPDHAGHDHSKTGGTDAVIALDAVTAARADVRIVHDRDGKHVLSWDPTKGAPIDAIVSRAQSLGFPAGYGITYPQDKRGSYTLQRFFDQDAEPNGRASEGRTTYVDQYTGSVISDFPASTYGPIAKATDFGISLHEGREWGIWSQLLILSGTLALLFSCASAIVMWRKRRPKGIGAPRRAPDRRLRAGVVAITIGLGAFFPLLGLSIVALLVFDWVVVRNVAPLRRALGAA